MTFSNRLLEVRKRVLGPEHPDTAITLNNLAALYRSQEKYEEALSLLEQALAFINKALGPNHPDTKTVLANRAALLEIIEKEESDNK